MADYDKYHIPNQGDSDLNKRFDKKLDNWLFAWIIGGLSTLFFGLLTILWIHFNHQIDRLLDQNITLQQRLTVVETKKRP